MNMVPLPRKVYSSGRCLVERAVARDQKRMRGAPSNSKALLPPGTDLKTAESGFKSHGQFIAALHVSKNLNIPVAVEEAERVLA